MNNGTRNSSLTHLKEVETNNNVYDNQEGCRKYLYKMIEQKKQQEGKKEILLNSSKAPLIQTRIYDHMQSSQEMCFR